MGDIISAIVVVTVALGLLLAFMGALYALGGLLPDRFKEGFRAWAVMVPVLFAITVGLLVPAIRTVYASLFSDNGETFIGLENYGEIFANTGTRLTVFNSLAWVVVGTIGTLAIALTVARFADGLRAESALKSLIFLPGAISLVGTGLIWSFVYAGPPSDVGLLNAVTGAIPGLPESLGGLGDRLWLVQRDLGGIDPPASAPGINTFLLIIIFIWAQAGIATVIFSAAIKGVPDSLIEAGRIDGASSRQIFFGITIPYIRSTIVTVATLITVGGLKAFDIVAATTGGRFGTSTIANEFYVTRFVQGRVGLGAALAVLIFILVIPVMIINRQAQARAEEMMGG